MWNKELVLMLTILLLIFATLLTLVVIAVAIFFQNLLKKIEKKINSTERVAKMTVKPKKRQNQYSRSRKRIDDGVVDFYEAPQLTDRQREALKKKAAQQQGGNDGASLAGCGNIKRATNSIPPSGSKDSYIVCINDEEVSQGMTTVHGALLSSKVEGVAQMPKKSQTCSQTLVRTDEDDGSYIECVRGEKPVVQSSLPYTTTLPVHAVSPIKEDFGRAFKSLPRGKVMQQGKSNRCKRPVNLNNTSLNDEEDYEIMTTEGEIYENSGYMNGSNEELYGNQEIVEQENRRVSQRNTKHFVQEHSITWHSNQNSDEDEVYENQEIVDRERNKRANNINDNYLGTMVGHNNSTTSQLSAECFELYENYIHEETYENC